MAAKIGSDGRQASLRSCLGVRGKCHWLRRALPAYLSRFARAPGQLVHDQWALMPPKMRHKDGIVFRELDIENIGEGTAAQMMKMLHCLSIRLAGELCDHYHWSPTKLIPGPKWLLIVAVYFGSAPKHRSEFIRRGMSLSFVWQRAKVSSCNADKITHKVQLCPTVNQIMMLFRSITETKGFVQLECAPLGTS